MRRIAVLRPEPGNAATVARVVAIGREAIRLPLFVVVPVAWDMPDPADHDALLLTSANAVRHGGDLSALSGLPVLAVGAATAAAARGAGFDVIETGETDAVALLAGTRFGRILHLAGRERTVQAGGETGGAAGGAVVAIRTVYATEPLAADVSLANGATVLLHSARAAARFAALTGDRARIRIAALSAKVAAAAGDGWERVAIAAAPRDEAVLAAAVSLDD